MPHLREDMSFEVPKIKKGDTTAYIDGDCQSCGLCIVECPAKAIGFKTPLEDRGKNTLEAVFREKFIQGVKPLIINFIANIVHIMRMKSIP